MDSVTGRPDDYEELFSEYFPMMRSTVFRAGIASEDVEDVAMDILARFIEKDGIAHYDPNYMHDVGESPDLPGARYRKAKFKGMLRGFTAVYVMQYRDKQKTKHRREPWRLEAEVRAGGEEASSGTAYSETHTIGDTEVAVCIVEALKAARKVLQAKTTETRNYDLFLDLALQHGLMHGKIDRKAIKDELGISISTLNVMVKELRDVLRPLLSEVGVVAELAS